MQATAPDKLRNIQTLRAAAALMVVAYHAQAIMHQSWLLAELYPWGSIGQAGVDVFFVISGFVMVYVTPASMAPGQFLKKRIIRIVPLYYLTTLVVFVLAWAFPGVMADAPRAIPDELIRSLAFIPFEKSNGKAHPILFVGWSLNYEMMFYLLFALSLVLRRWRVAIVILVLCGLALLHGRVLSGRIMHFFSNPIILEFGAGMALAWWYAGASEARLKKLCGLAWPMVVLGVVGMICLHKLGAARVLAYGLPSTLIVFGAILLECQGKTLSGGQPLGDASYAIYLTHFFAIQAFVLLDDAQDAGAWLALVYACLAVVAATALGVFVHLRAEIPLLRWIRMRADGGRKRPGADWQ